MSDDISSTATDKARAAAAAAAAAGAAKGASASVEDKLDEARERFESVKEDLGEAVEGGGDKAAQGVKEGAEDDKHSLLGDLWKGARRWFGRS